MFLNAPKEKAFERAYMAKFDDLANSYGLPIEYKEDSAAIDRGIHLVAQDRVTNTRVWFQFKGIHKTTLSLKTFSTNPDVVLKINLRHLRAWYRSAEVVYLIVYIESADIFLGEDVRNIVNRIWGDELFNPKAFKPKQKSVNISISKTSILGIPFWQNLYKHKSIRADGGYFRGRPLGHDRDPFSGVLRNIAPELFMEIATDLLAQHGYRADEIIHPDFLFPNKKLTPVDASLTIGTLFDKYEIFVYAFNQVLPNSDGFRHQGETQQVHGRCAVLIHANVEEPPDKVALNQFAHTLLNDKKIDRLLVFANAEFLGENCCFATYRMAFEGTPLKCLPQHIEDIGINFTLATNTYEKFVDKVSWLGGKVHRKEEKLFALSPFGGPPVPLD